MKSIFILVLIAGVHGCLGVTIDVDTSAAPDLANFGRRVKATLEDRYPYIARLLHSPTFRRIDRIRIYFDPNYNRIAKADQENRLIVGGVRYYRNNQHDVGSMIHEMTHIIQQYGRNNCASWITEGLADWVRYWHYERNRKPGKPGRGSHYMNGYGISAYFLDWINARWNVAWRSMNYWINKDCREGTFNYNIFPRLTRKTVDQLWNDMMNS